MPAFVFISLFEQFYSDYNFTPAISVRQHSISLVFPFLEMSLEEYKNGLNDRVLPLEEAVTFFRQIVVAEAYVQSLHIFHNDIKPSNVLVFCNGNKQKTANLCDFEFAERCGFPRARTGGTKYYEPPEGQVFVL